MGEKALRIVENTVLRREFEPRRKIMEKIKQQELYNS
jgi:hypothetical protein